MRAVAWTEVLTRELPGWFDLTRPSPLSRLLDHLMIYAEFFVSDERRIMADVAYTARGWYRITHKICPHVSIEDVIG